MRLGYVVCCVMHRRLYCAVLVSFMVFDVLRVVLVCFGLFVGVDALRVVLRGVLHVVLLSPCVVLCVCFWSCVA